jgi:hypothetical protein
VLGCVRYRLVGRQRQFVGQVGGQADVLGPVRVAGPRRDGPSSQWNG